MWEHIIGHTEQKKFLQNYLQAKERPHALLFSGAAGLGKRTLALKFAKALLCFQHNGTDGCEACRLMNLQDGNLSHPDFVLVQHEWDDKKDRLIIVSLKDRLRDTIIIDQIRELTAKTALAPVMSQTRVCIVEDADTMVPAAANAFLKLLEEPPAGWVIILLAANVNKLLPTIMSRVVQLRFQAIEPQLVEQALQARQIETAKAAVLARISEGSIGLALNLAAAKGQLDVFECRKQAAAFLEALPLAMPMNYLAGRSWLDKKVQREQALLLVQLWQLLLRDLMMCKLQLYDRIYNIDLLDELKSQSSGWQLSALKQALVIVQEAYDALVSSVGMKTALETMALKIDKIYKE